MPILVFIYSTVDLLFCINSHIFIEQSITHIIEMIMNQKTLRKRSLSILQSSLGTFNMMSISLLHFLNLTNSLNIRFHTQAHLILCHGYSSRMVRSIGVPSSIQEQPLKATQTSTKTRDTDTVSVSRSPHTRDSVEILMRGKPILRVQSRRE